LKFLDLQIERYTRNILVPEIGTAGQRRLLKSKVLVVGCGGLGVPVILYLAAAGVGQIGVIDHDRVDVSNLQRQVIYDTTDLGKKKVSVIKKKVEKLNPDVKIVPYEGKITSENALDIIKDYDMVADCSDNFPTRYLVNDACVLLKKPLSHGAVLRFDGQVTTIIPGESACYRCVFKEPPKPGLVPSCREAGIIGATCGVIGSIQALEIIKYLTDSGELLTNKFLVFSGLKNEFRTVKIAKNNNCPVCGENPTITSLIDYEESCGGG